MPPVSNPSSDVASVSVLSSSVPDDISGPCDEAEHADDPRCTGVGVAVDDDSSGHDASDDDSLDDDSSGSDDDSDDDDSDDDSDDDDSDDDDIDAGDDIDDDSDDDD
jgi:hypothetical protein